MTKDERGLTDRSIDWDATSDETLLDLMRGSDDRAFAELFRRHQAFARRVARRFRLHGEEDDVVSEAFVAILHQLRQGRGPRQSFRAYLATSVRHEALRRVQHQRRVLPTGDSSVVEAIAGPAPDTFDVSERDAVHRAFSLLSPQQRDVLWSVDVLGHAPCELAARRRTSANSVSALVYRCRKAFAAAYS